MRENVKDAQRVETATLPAENIVSAKRITGSRLQNKLGEKRKGEDAYEGDLINIVSKIQKKKKTRKDKWK